MAERITVALSDETANLLDLYCKQRQMNKSSAGAGFLVDGLEDWLMKQREIGRKMTEVKTQSHFDFSLLARNRDLTNSTLNDELRFTMSRITIEDNVDANKKILKFNLMASFDYMCNSIVPIKSFADETYNRLCTALYARLILSEIAQKVYVDGLSLADKQYVNEQLQRLVHFDFKNADKYKETIATQEQLSTLISWHKANVDISQNVYDDIQTFFKEHTNGKIIVIGETGAGKTTFATELAQLFHCDLIDDEVGEELRSNANVIDFFNKENRTVGTIHGKDFNTVIARMATMVELGIKEENDVDILKNTKPQDIYFVKVAHKETNQSRGLHSIYKRCIERGIAKRVELVGNVK